MPEQIPVLEHSVINSLPEKSFHEIADIVAQALFGEDVEPTALTEIVHDTLSFDTPVVHVHDNIYSLELFHGPTLAFKDVGARFMARMLGYFIKKRGIDRTVNVLVATSGDTGSAVANGFLGIAGIRVFVLHPKGKVSPIQECQFTTLGQNIVALEVDGTFDDCQSLVKQAFSDTELNERMQLTSANSINVARFLPQSFYYFHAYAQLRRLGRDELTVCVPSGNLGNITAGLVAQRMGLPVRRFLSASNMNDVFPQYLSTGKFVPRPSVATLANAMDVGNPSNFARILDMFGQNHADIARHIIGFSYSDAAITDTLYHVYRTFGYLLDPHGACGYQALLDRRLAADRTGLFLETAHPAKFKETVDYITGASTEIPVALASFMDGEKQSIEIDNSFASFRDYLYEI
jgi:threonine synthase